MNWSSNSRTLAGGMILALAILVGVGLVTYRTNTQLVEAVAARNRDHRIIENLQLLLTELDEAETGKLGYLITGDPRYLEPYEEALGTIPRTVQVLDGWAAVSPEQHERVRSLQPLIDAKLAELKETIRLLREQGFGAARTAVLSNKGKRIMDDIRRLGGQMETRAEALLVELDREIQTITRRNQLVLVIGTSVSIGLLLLVFYLLKQEVSTRQRAEERFRGLLESAPDSMVIVNQSGRIVLVNDQAERLFGYTRQEMLGKAVEILIPDRFASAHAGHRDRFFTDPPTRTRAMSQSREVHAQRKDGSEFPVEISLSPLETPQGVLVSSAIRDITERKRTEERIQRLNADLQNRTVELEATNQELEALTYSVSHDLRSPLRHIDGFSTLLVEDFGIDLSDDARRYLTCIRDGTRQMGQLVDNLLNFVRVRRRELNIQLTGLDSLVAEVVSDLKAETAGRAIEWKVERLPYVECDPALMKLVFTNLLSNAVKYTRPRPRATIEVGIRTEYGKPAIFVRDNGVGFSMKYADRLFGVFQRLHRATDFEGTGVGLASVQRIIQKHGGRIWAEAEVDRGATFYFTLWGLEALQQEEELAA